MRKLTIVGLTFLALVLSPSRQTSAWLSFSPSIAEGAAYVRYAAPIPLVTSESSVSSTPLDKAYQHLAEVMDKYHQTFDVYTYEGFDFDTDRDMPWFEGTAQMVVAYWILGDHAKARFYLEKLREAQETAPHGNGKGIVAAPSDGLTTGFDWLYFNRLHVGATAWFIFAELMYNPFWHTTICYDFYPPVGVGIEDIQAVAGRWRTSETHPDPDNNPATSNYETLYDVVYDGIIDIRDIMLVVVHRGVQCQCQERIEFTYVPPYGSFENLQGQVRCVEPANYKVAVYIFVSGWWTKPYWASPLTPINNDGRWTTDITTGGTDQFATKIAAFLVPNGYDPPLMSGGQTLPAELFASAVAWVMAEREAVFRTIEFSGYTWKVKASETPAGPGPNYFSDRVEDVWVDEAGQLHLRIVQRNGRWYATEVFTEAPLGYGKYVFRIASRVDQLDKNIVLGLFTWDDTAPEHHYREIDIEFSRWGEEQNDNAQFVVQPWNTPGNMYRFNVALPADESTHGFDWRADRVFFQSLYGHQPFPGPQEAEIESWAYTGGDTPPAGEGNARINLWLFNSNPPSDGEEAEVIIKEFEFVPWTE